VCKKEIQGEGNKSTHFLVLSSFQSLTNHQQIHGYCRQ